MQQKSQELVCCEVQARQASLDLGVEPFGQQPKGMCFLQTAAFERVRHAFQVIRWLLGQFGVRFEGQ